MLTRVRSAQDEPMSDAIDARTHLGEMPPVTPAGFPVTQSFYKQWTELDISLAQRLMADLDTALVQQFMDIPVTQGKALV